MEESYLGIACILCRLLKHGSSLMWVFFLFFFFLTFILFVTSKLSSGYIRGEYTLCFEDY